MWYQEDYRVGEIIESLEPYRVTEEEIIEVGSRWDPRPYHTDPTAAANRRSCEARYCTSRRTHRAT